MSSELAAKPTEMNSTSPDGGSNDVSTVSLR